MFRAFNSKMSQRVARFLGLSVVVALLAASSGCALLETCGCKFAPPPSPPINDVTAFWYEQVQIVQDPQNGGRPLPGLVGRVYLGSGDTKKVMVEANGAFYAEMWDETPGAEPRKLVDWSFDKESLKQLKRPDFVGMGYTLFLPWETYSPAFKKVQVRMWYVEPGKAPRYAEPQTIALKSGDQATPLVQQINYEYAPGQRVMPTMGK
jgi:hypothetical protein